MKRYLERYHYDLFGDQNKTVSLSHGGEKLISLWDTFERFFNRKVDLLTDSSIHNPFLRKSIDATKILIYDGAGQKVLV